MEPSSVEIVWTVRWAASGKARIWWVSTAVAIAHKVLTETRQDLLNVKNAPRVSSRDKPESQSAASVKTVSFRRSVENRHVRIPPRVTLDLLNGEKQLILVALSALKSLCH